jgi:YD repeat-containing protein
MQRRDRFREGFPKYRTYKIFNISEGAVLASRFDQYGIDTASGFLWLGKNGDWKKYDVNGRMTEYGTRTGITGKLIYETGGDEKLIGVADSNDRQVIWYEYNGDLISAVRDNVNRRVDYTYTDGLLTNVRDVLLYDTGYEYYGSGTLKKITFPDGRQDNMVYDGSENVGSVVNSQGVGTFFQYDYDKAKKEYYSQIKTSSGMVKEVIYDREGDTKQVDINGRTVKKVLKDERDLIITDEKGNVTREEYDEWENLTGKVYPDGSEEKYEYEHDFNQVTQHTDRNGNVMLYEYDN